MSYNSGFISFLKRQKKTVVRKASILNAFIMILQLAFGSYAFTAMPLSSSQASAVANDGICSSPVDAVLVLDRSGSMGYTSKCEWWKYVCLDKPSCTSWEWQKNINYWSEYDPAYQEDWCTDRNQAHPHESKWTEYNPTRMNAAKSAANNFLSKMGTGDQSALVSFANTAALDRTLTNTHSQTQTAVNALSPFGATNIGDAINMGVQELISARANPAAVKMMILLTDGRANQPNGTGYGENAADVAYAISKSDEAKNNNIKIFTIGLGTNGASGEINETMLQQIAANTGGTYYHSPTPAELQFIYDSIAQRACYGSISGCKYDDSDNDGRIAGEQTVPGWPIILSNDDGSLPMTKETDSQGCFRFDNLPSGSYTLSEGSKPGVVFTQTYPPSGDYEIALSEGEPAINKDFGNYIPVCGNNIKDSGEECDGAVGVGVHQSCSDDCKLVDEPWCGDGIKNGDEECDGTDGIGAHQACGTDCKLNNLPWCGDGIKNGDEECDGTDGVGEHQSCNDGCMLVSEPWCGDGIKNGNEECDYNDRLEIGWPFGGICGQDCRASYPSAFCGDGQVNQLDEECDDGNTASGDGCSSDCRFEYCGDGIKNNSNEECDDGNTESGDGCSSECQIEQGPVCGDGKKEGAEECDDGNINSNDGCSLECKIEYCGDGIKNGNEQCDDGNTESGDGCSATCQTEQISGCGDGYVDYSAGERCEGQQTNTCIINDTFGSQTCNSLICQWNPCEIPGECGNGTVESGEECDDGNSIDNDDCTNDCKIPAPSCNSSISGFKYNSAAENKLSGWVIELWNADTNTLVSTTTTADITGQFVFEGLCQGEYRVFEQQQAGWRQIMPADPEYFPVSITGNNQGFDGLDFWNIPAGSLKVCKIEDQDSSLRTTEDQLPVEGFQFILESPSQATSSLLTGKDGCAVFEDLDEGVYTVSENAGKDWQPISPAGGISSTTVSNNEQSSLTFYNYRYSSISGHKYKDNDGQTSSADDRTLVPGWVIKLFNAEDHQTELASTTTDSSGFFKFSSLFPGVYFIDEALQDLWQMIERPTTTISLLYGQDSENNDFVNYHPGGNGGPVCGDGIKNGNEECDGSDGVPSGYTCSSSCQLQSSGGGGGGGGSVILISSGTSAPVIIETQKPEPQILGEKLEPVMTLSKKAAKASVNPGNKLDYSFTIKNTGNYKLINVHVVDTLPAGFTFTASGKNTNSWSLGDLQPGEEKTLKFRTAAAKTIKPGKYTNTAVAKADNHKEVTAKADVQVKRPAVIGAKLKKTGIDANEASKYGLALIVALWLVFFTQRMKKELAIPKAKLFNKILNIAMAAVVAIMLVFPFYPILDYHSSWLISNAAQGINKIVHKNTAAKAPIANRLIIPKLNTSVAYNKSNDDSLLSKGALLLPYGSDIGKKGNALLTTHRYQYFVPGHTNLISMNKLVKGDILIVTKGEKPYFYQVKEIKKVPETDVSILDQTNDSRLTIYTCDSFFSQENRLVVIADLIK